MSAGDDLANAFEGLRAGLRLVGHFGDVPPSAVMTNVVDSRRRFGERRALVAAARPLMHGGAAA